MALFQEGWTPISHILLTYSCLLVIRFYGLFNSPRPVKFVQFLFLHQCYISRHLRADARSVGRGLAPVELEGLAPDGTGAELDGEGLVPVDGAAGADCHWG